MIATTRQPTEPVPVAVLDSITKLGPGHRGAVVVAGSHGGLYCGWVAAAAAIRAVVLNDAGGGLDGAGTACLAPLDTIGMAALTVDHRSARIGDGQDMLLRGRVSNVNAAAAALGCTAGVDVAACLALLRAASLPTGTLSPVAESRVLLSDGSGVGLKVVGIDSASLIGPQDRHCIVVTGSHGGLLGGVPATAIREPCVALAFNDAGIGADAAGCSRLPVLDTMGIAAVTVSHLSARIGDARSSWATGRVSCANELARQAGVAAGMTLQAAVRRLAGRATGKPESSG